jgi:hypothetical protein
MQKTVNNKLDIIERLDFLVEDSVTRTIYSTQIMRDIIDAKEEILQLRIKLRLQFD